MKKLILIAATVLGLTSCNKQDTLIVKENTVNSTLTLEFNSINKTPVSNPNSLSQWNTFFKTNVNASTPFNSVSITGNEVKLKGATNLVIEQLLFYKNKSIISIIDDSSLLFVRENSFENSSLKTFKSNTLKNTSSGSFKACNIITFIATNLEKVDSSCFDYCLYLDSLNTPKVKEIKMGAFSGCSALKNVYLPSVLSIEDYAFIYNSSLKYLDISNCQLLQGSSIFDAIYNSNIIIKIPISLNNNINITNFKNQNNVILIN